MKSNIFNFLRRNKEIIEEAILVIFDKLGANNLFRLINRKKAIILMYHGISDKSFTYYNRRYHPKSSLEREIKYLKKKKYYFITLTDWLKIVENRIKIRNKYVILTFDDGFKNVIDNAYPIMKKYGAKGCFYIISGIIGKYKLIWQDYIEILLKNHKDSQFKFNFKGKEIEYSLNSYEDLRQAIGDIKVKLRTLNPTEKNEHIKQFKNPNDISHLKDIPNDYIIANWEDIEQLDPQIIEIGCHGATHTNLENLLSEEDFQKELYESKLEIEKRINLKIAHICYPTGSYNDRVIKCVKNYGFSTGVSVIDGLNSNNTDLFQLKRVKMENNFILFKYKVSGLFYFIKKKFGRIIKI